MTRPPRQSGDSVAGRTAAPRDERGGIQMVTRAAAVLEALADAGGALSLSQIAAGTGLPKTTVHRICRALEAVGYVGVDKATGRRELGRGLLRFAVIGRRDLRAVIGPYLAGLSHALNETVDLAVLDGGRVLFLAQHAAPRRELMAIARVGEHFPAHSMASGKVLLARLPDEELRALLPAPPASSRDVAAARRALLAELDEIRATGIGYEREELRHGICAMAVAVTDSDGSSASIAVPMPAARFRESERQVATALLSLRDEVQQALSGVAGGRSAP